MNSVHAYQNEIDSLERVQPAQPIDTDVSPFKLRVLFFPGHACKRYKNLAPLFVFNELVGKF